MKLVKSALALAMSTVMISGVNAAELTTTEQKVSYIFGLQVGQQLMQSGITDIDVEAFTLAISDVVAKQQPRLSQEEVQSAMNEYRAKMEAEAKVAASKNVEAGKAFLSENKKKPGVKETASGLQYKVVKAGTGKQPAANSTVVVNYRGTLIDGTEFDSSYKRGQPATFPVNGVIQGWQEGIPMMKEGGKWELYIPSELAYGTRGTPGIGPNSTLIFEVELIEVK